MNDEVIELNPNTDTENMLVVSAFFAGLIACVGVIFLPREELPHPFVEIATMIFSGVFVALVLLRCVLRESYLIDFNAGQLMLKRRVGPWQSRRSLMAFEEVDKAVLTSHLHRDTKNHRSFLVWGLDLLTKAGKTINLLDYNEDAEAEYSFLADKINHRLARRANARL